MGADSRHIIITGGSSGIGYALACQLVRNGDRVSIMARTPQALDTAKTQLEQYRLHPSQQILALPADVSCQEQVNQAVQQAIAQSGMPDMLINCAGIAHPGYFREVPIEVFETTMAINYFGTLYCIRAVLPYMEQRRSGHIVMTSSGSGLIGIYGYSPYSPSKFALRGLAESLRGELKPWGIGISIVYPPDTDTPQLEQENKTKPLETQRITATAAIWTADHVAAEILNGVRKNQFAIAPGTEMSVLSRFHSIISPALNWYFDRIVATVQTDKSHHANQVTK
ncbi:MAG: SDR family oxidoreductase [Elainellaceae cyanobacterium]